MRQSRSLLLAAPALAASGMLLRIAGLQVSALVSAPVRVVAWGTGIVTDCGARCVTLLSAPHLAFILLHLAAGAAGLLGLLRRSRPWLAGAALLAALAWVPLVLEEALLLTPSGWRWSPTRLAFNVGLNAVVYGLCAAALLLAFARAPRKQAFPR
jgi:hypothetical protein